MLKASALACLVAGLLALLLFDMSLPVARDAVIVAAIALIGIYLSWTLPIGDG